jgi:lysocardiolipin and lysophospholipid acyltransferase
VTLPRSHLVIQYITYLRPYSQLSIMATELRQRQKTAKVSEGTEEVVKVGHPAGNIKHGGPVQVLRLLLFVTYWLSSCCSYVRSTSNFGKLLTCPGLLSPSYLEHLYIGYAYMALTKQSFGIFVTTLTQWWAPTVVRISGDSSVEGMIKRTEDGRAELHFPDRLVMIANHQACSLLRKG